MFVSGKSLLPHWTMLPFYLLPLKKQVKCTAHFGKPPLATVAAATAAAWSLMIFPQGSYWFYFSFVWELYSETALHICLGCCLCCIPHCRNPLVRERSDPLTHTHKVPFYTQHMNFCFLSWQRGDEQQELTQQSITMIARTSWWWCVTHTVALCATWMFPPCLPALSLNPLLLTFEQSSLNTL